MNAQQILYRTRDKLYRTRLGNRVIILSKASGLYWVFARYFSKKKARLMFSNPTQNMINSRKFYDNNMDRVEEVISWLEDEQSKDCFRKMINFRCTCNVDEFPFCDGNSQYFMHDFIDYSQDEVLIDCGAFVGDGYDKFIKALKHYKANYKKIIAFEPDPDNVSILRKRKIPNINIINMGVSDKESVLYFERGGLYSSHFVDTKEKNIEYFEVPLTSIDNCSDCADATFIKMDVEGYELQALIGAENVIRKNRPNLAICIYHSDEDMVRIAKWIQDLGLGYKLYIRQHAFYIRTETVLYAIPEYNKELHIVPPLSTH